MRDGKGETRNRDRGRDVGGRDVEEETGRRNGEE
jgi:hypothetical protein